MFIQQNVTTVKADGDPTANICLIGEAPGAEEVRAGKPFVGAAGRVLAQCMHTAGIIRSDCYITNVVKERPTKNNITPYFGKKGFTEKGLRCRDQLIEELEETKCNVYVTLGATATMALIGRQDVTKCRGYIFESDILGGRKVIPIIHPAAALRGQYIFRHYISHDLHKAKRQSEFPEIRWPKMELTVDLSFEATIELLTRILHKSFAPVSFDIEVAQHEVSCISFTDDVSYAVSIPTDDRWTEWEELQIWRAIAAILESPKIKKVGQNLIFDMQFLLIRNGIQTINYLHYSDGGKGRCLIEDTMIGHSLIYPEFQKSLGFLASIYTDAPYWKDMVRFKGGNAKKEA